jgi:hypothetical protein
MHRHASGLGLAIEPIQQLPLRRCPTFTHDASVPFEFHGEYTMWFVLVAEGRGAAPAGVALT